MTNAQLAEQFSLLADLMELQGENPFKIKSYAKAAEVIKGQPTPLSDLDAAALRGIPGIGDAVAAKVAELLATGTLAQTQDLLSIIPQGVAEMLRINGLSPKKIAIIWKSLEITTPEQLEEACLLHRIAPVKGFGDKTEAAMLAAIRFYRHNKRFSRLSDVIPFALEVIAALRSAFPGCLLEPTGAYRRQVEVVERLELLTDLQLSDLTSRYSTIEGANLTTLGNDRLLLQLPGKPEVLFQLSSRQAFYKDLFRTTATEGFLAAFSQSHFLPETPDSEEAIFASNKLGFIHPALREDDRYLAKAAAGTLPALITAADIRGVIHAHSTYSDGKATLEAMARAAIERGYEYLVITDHSQAAFYASGLKPEQVKAQHEEIDRLNAVLTPFRIFKGIEADILADGSLDYEEDLRSTFDLVIASVHSNLGMTEEKATKRLLKAIAHPHTRILGHPTGRKLLVREGYPIDHKAVIDACAEHGVVIEINASPRRLDLDWRWVQYALDQGALLSINPDAHSIAGIEDIAAGVLAAQKGGLTADRNLSSYPLAAFEAFLNNK